MKLPALAIAASLAAGIFAGGFVSAQSFHVLALCLAAILVFLALGFTLYALHREPLAFAAALLAWCLLGTTAALLVPLQVPRDHITRAIAANGIDLRQPLRWHGRLRADPLRLPWGIRYEVDLSEVQLAGSWCPISGGLRANYFFDKDSPFDERAFEDADVPPQSLDSAADPTADPAVASAVVSGPDPTRAPHAPILQPLRAGDSVEVLVRAGPARNFADPGSFDYRAFLAHQNVDVTGTLRNAVLISPLPRPPPALLRRLPRIRGTLLAEIDAILAAHPARAAIARTMLLGDRSFLDSDQLQTFQVTGVYHVLVLAGLHIGFLAAAFLWAGRKLRLSLATRTLMTIALLAGYVGIVEDRPPILRAALMAAAYLLGRMLFRRTAVLNAVGLAAILILAAQPYELPDASFLLSFLAAITIGAIASPLLGRTIEPYRRALNHLPDVPRDAAFAPRVAQFRLDLRSAANGLAARLPPSLARFADIAITAPCRTAIRFAELTMVSLFLQLGMLPLMAQYFHRISLVGFAANIPAVLLTGIIVPLGFLTLGLGLLSRALGRVLGAVLSALIGALLRSVNWFADVRLASFRVPTPSLVLVLAFFLTGVLFAVAIVAKPRWPRDLTFAAILLLAALIATSPFPPRLVSGRLEVTVLDVGQGDSIFVAFPDGKTMLVDGGGLAGSSFIHGHRPGIDIGEDVVSAFLWERGIKHLDVVALTHAHHDHLGGLSAVLRNFRVGQLWVARDVRSSEYRALIAEAVARSVPVAHLVQGQSFQWDAVRIQILWPENDDQVRSGNNDDSLVIRLQDNREAFLLAGDIERPVERSLLAHPDDLPSAFLKVPHHGSKTSSTQPFLDAVHPRFAAVSVGAANSFGHPNAEVVDRINAEGAQLFRTDRDGAITILSDGTNIDVHSFLNSAHK